jgi:hypothetical protein
MELVEEWKVKRLLHDMIDELAKLYESNQYNQAIFEGLHKKIGDAVLTNDYHIDY